MRSAWQRLDAQTVFVLIAAAALVVLQDSVGSRRFFREEVAAVFAPETRELLAWAWWFGVQGITGFLLPAGALLYIFRRTTKQSGLELGDWKFALVVAAAYLPLVVLGTWFLSAGADFQSSYPHYHPAAFDWSVFILYEALFLLYWIGWEYLWRGFVLFGTAHVFGLYAILVQALPFTLLHLSKPLPETVLSLVGGLALGALVWRCRSFWIAVPIHAAQMMILDLWCSLRLRSGVDGVGWEAFRQLF